MATNAWTIRSILRWAGEDFQKRGIKSARLDAELLVAHALQVERVALYLDLDRPLSEEERAAVRALVIRRREREPVAYILGYKDFYGRRFAVDRHVLVPRPDTETLAEVGLSLITSDSMRVLDVGTGSGILAVTLAAAKETVRVDAVDVSAAALEIAKINAKAHGVEPRIEFFESDGFAALAPARRYDVIVSNPPYIPEGDIDALQAEVSKHEPRAALSGGTDGLDFFGSLLRESGKWLVPGGQLLLEVGQSQAKAVIGLAEAEGGWEPGVTHADLNRVPRVVQFRRLSA